MIYDMYSRVERSLPPLVRVDVTSVCSNLQSLTQLSSAMWLQNASVSLHDKAEQTQKCLHPGSVFFLLDLNCLGHSGLVLAQSLSFLPALFPEQALSEAAKARGLVHARPWYVAGREFHFAPLRADSGSAAKPATCLSVGPGALCKVITHRFKHNSRPRHAVYKCSRSVAKLWH